MNKTFKSILRVFLSAVLSITFLISMFVPALAATPPAISTLDAAAIMVDSAILVGNLSSLGSSTSVKVFFEYGTTINYGNSTSAVVVTSVGPYTTRLTGVSSGVTFHFRARVDAGANGYAVGEDKIFTTGTRPASIITAPATNIIGNGAKLNGTLGDLGTASSVNVYFEYGTTTSFGMKSAIVKQTAITNIAINVSDLTPDTLYYFRIVADSGIHGISYGANLFFRTPQVSPPEVSTLPTPVVTNTTANLVGNVSTMGTATSLTVSFEYGTTSDYGLVSGTQGKSSSGYNGGFTIEIKELIPGTTYHFRAKADGGVNGVAYGEDYTFKTTGLMPITPPTVETFNATNITTGSVTLNGNLKLLGTATEVDVYFEYGTDNKYGTATIAELLTQTGEFSYTINDLAAGTTYHFRAKANGFSNGIGSGSDVTFTTASISPSVSTSEATSIGVKSVTLNGVLNSTGTSKSIRLSFEYGTTENYGFTTISVNLNESGPFSINLPGLKMNTEYHYRAIADDGISGIIDGEDMTFTTLSPASITVAPDSVINIAPLEATVGVEVNISVPMVNNGSVEGTIPVILKVNGLIENSQDVTIPAGARQNVTFTVVKNIAGTYQVEINGLTGSFVVSSGQVTTSSTATVPTTTTAPKSPNTMMILAIGVGVAIVVGLLIFMLMRRRA